MGILHEREKMTVMEKTEIHERFSDYYQQWYRKWNHIFATIFCLLSFLCLYVLILNIWNYQCDDSTKQSIKTSNFALNEKNVIRKYCSVTEKCEVICKKLTSGLIIADELRKLFESNSFQKCSKTIPTLKITNSTFPSDTLSKEFLQVDGYSYLEVEIESCYVKIIDENAFSGHSMLDTINLLIQNGDFLNIKNGAFHIPKLKELKFENINVTNIEPRALEGISNLNSLQILKTCQNNDLLENITGSGDFTFNLLSIADIRYNTLKVIKEKTFSSFVNVISLYLASSKLELIEQRAFINCQKLQQLDISDNLLHTLSSDVFAFSIVTPLHIKNNKWNCNSDLVWFCDWNILDINETYCSAPKSEDGKLINESVCLFTPTETTSSTQKIPVHCNDELLYVYKEFLNPIKVRSEITTSKIIHFNVTKKNPTGNEIEFLIVFPDESTPYTLIWFQENIDFDANSSYTEPTNDKIGCILAMSNFTTISLEDPKENYIICATTDIDILPSPFSCRFLETTMSNDFDTNNPGYNSILIISSAILISSIFGFVIGTFRRYSRKESLNNVELCKKEHEFELHQNDTIRYKNPFPTHHYEQLVFESPKYEIPRRFPNLHRSESDCSIGTVYITPLEPTPYELLAWKISQQYNYRDNSSPPPLPPHPLRRTETISTQSIKSFLSNNDYNLI